MKKRIINIRFLFVCFIGLILGITLSILFHYSFIGINLFIISILFIALISAVGIIYAFLTKNKNSKCRARKNISFILICSGIGLLISFSLGAIIPMPAISKIDKVPVFSDTVVVSGRVTDYVVSSGTSNRFLIDNCLVMSDDTSIKCDYKILVYTSNFSNVQLGNNVTFEAKLKKLNFVDSSDRQNIVNGIIYSTYASSIIIDDGNPTLKDSIKGRVKDLLYSNLNSDNASICFALLFGDKYSLSTEIKENFSYSGIYHLLAVSGLHVGVLVAIIWFLLDRIKINKYLRLIIFSVILFCYVYLCSFSPSVCRAGIMAIILALCNTFMLEYDILSSLSFAGILILCLSPLSIFSVSFQLSFLCIFSIIALTPTLNRLFKKIKMPKFLSGSLSLSIAVNLVTLPICMNVYTTVSLLGILTNIFVLPIFSVVYVLLFVCVLIGLIIPIFGAVLVVPNIFLHLIKVIADKVSSIPFGVFKAFNVGYFVLFFLILALICVHFLMTKKIFKLLFVSIFSIITASVLIIGFIPKTYETNSLLACKQYSSNVIVYCSKNKNVLIGSDIDLKSLQTISKNLKIKNIDTIIAFDLQLNDTKNLNNIIDDFGVENLILPLEYKDYNINLNISNCEYLVNDYYAYSLTVSPIYSIGKTTGVIFSTGKTKYLLPNNSNNTSQNRALISNYSWVDCIVVDDSSIWETVNTSQQKIVLSNIANFEFLI